MLSRRGLLASAVGAGLAPLGFARPARAADKPAQIRIDWATYNPVSMVLKEQGLLEKEFAKDGIGILWVQTLGSNKALEFLNAGSIDFGSTAGSAALLGRINGDPIKSIYVYSKPEWTALGHAQGYRDQQNRRPQGQARRGDARHRSAHFPGAGAALGRDDREGHQRGVAAASRRQDRAHSRRRRRLGRPRSDDGGRRRSRTARGCSIATRTPIPTASSIRARTSSRTIPIWPAACSRSTTRPANIASAITTTRSASSWA